jgi:hypothetical protein
VGGAEWRQTVIVGLEGGLFFHDQVPACQGIAGPTSTSSVAGEGRHCDGVVTPSRRFFKGGQALDRCQVRDLQEAGSWRCGQ